MKEGADTYTFAKGQEYTRFGKFLRKTKIDELPQLFNVMKGDLSLVGPRAEEEKTIKVIPKETRDILLSVKPGLTSLSSIQFFDEGNILEKSNDPHSLYWHKIKPIKIVLDMYYIENKCVLLDLAILYMTAKKIIKSLFK